MTAFNFIFRHPDDNWQSRLLYAVSAMGFVVIGLGSLIQFWSKL